MKLIICDGVVKSGSTFFFQLVQRVMHTIKPADVFDGKIPDYSYTNNGVENGFIWDPILLMQDLKKLEGRLPNVNLVIKTHYLKEISCEIAELDVIHFITVRDPFDTALALYDQSKREKANADAGKPFRKGFKEIDTLDKALNNAMQFVRKVSIANSGKVHLLKYPEFVFMKDSCRDLVSSVLGVDKETLSNAAKRVDEMSRKGDVWTEFNQGIHGRGAMAMEMFDPAKAKEASTVFQSLFID